MEVGSNHIYVYQSLTFTRLSFSKQLQKKLQIWKPWQEDRIGHKNPFCCKEDIN